MPPLVLYVEDDEQNRKVMRLRLRERYRLVIAGSDREACEVVRAHGAELGCILMDIELRGSVLDGVKLARLFTGRGLDEPLPPYALDLPAIDAPLLFVTAYGGVHDPGTLKAAGGCCVVHKPVDFTELTAAMGAVITAA